MKDEEIIKRRGQAEAYFRQRFPKEVEKHLSDFGAYCVEQWLTGRHPKTSYQFLAVDFLRSFAHRTGTRGNSDIMSGFGRVSTPRWGDENYDDPMLLVGRDSTELARFIESSALRDSRLSERSRIVLILYYEWGFNLKEIGDLFSVSESRASQMLASALSRQKERVQAADASLSEGERQRREQEALSREVQKGSSIDRKAEEIMERIREEKRARMGFGEIEKILQAGEEIRSFACESF